MISLLLKGQCAGIVYTCMHVIYHHATLRNNECVCFITMVEGLSSTTTAPFAYRMTVGWSKRFSQPWDSVMKRIYVSEETLLWFHDLKKSGSFASDDSALHYLLSHHRLYPFTLWIGSAYTHFWGIMFSYSLLYRGIVPWFWYA